MHVVWEQGNINTSGANTSANYAIRTNYIPCKPGDQFIKYNLLNGKPATDFCYYYNASKVFLSRNNGSNIAPENAAYMRTVVNRGSGNTIVPSDGKSYAILRFGNVLSNEVGSRAYYTQSVASHVMDINFPVSAGDKIACMILEWGGDMPPTFSVRGLNGSTASSPLATANNLYQSFACEIATDYPSLRIRADVATTPSSATRFTALVFKLGADKISNLAYALSSQIDATLAIPGKAADAKETGDKIAEIGNNTQQINNGVKNFVDVLFPQKSGFSGTLQQNSVSYSTGAISVSLGRFCASSFCKYTTDMVVSLNLPEYLWHAWSYSTAADTYPTHSNTGKVLVDGAVPIFIQKKIQDAYFVFEIRRKDGEALTTDLDDPTSDYSRIMDALRVTTARPAVEGNNDGYIYRLESNPSPIPIGENALGYSEFLTQTWDTFLADYPAEVTKTAIGVSSTTESITTEYTIYKYVLAPRDWTRTVFLSAGCHGNEYEGFWGLYRIMRMIWDEGYKFPNLRKLRYNTRFVIVPIWNPWGVENRVRECPLGFPTQENLNTSVTVDDTTYAAFTSKECQAIKEVGPHRTRLYVCNPAFSDHAQAAAFEQLLGRPVFVKDQYGNSLYGVMTSVQRSSQRFYTELTAMIQEIGGTSSRTSRRRTAARSPRRSTSRAAACAPRWRSPPRCSTTRRTRRACPSASPTAPSAA